MNTVMLVGKVYSEPEFRDTEHGLQVTLLLSTIDMKREEPLLELHKIDVREKNSTRMKKAGVKKGHRLAIRGRLRPPTVNPKSKKDHESCRVIVYEFTLLEGTSLSVKTKRPVGQYRNTSVEQAENTKRPTVQYKRQPPSPVGVHEETPEEIRLSQMDFYRELGGE